MIKKWEIWIFGKKSLKISETLFQNAETRFQNAKFAKIRITFASTWKEVAQKNCLPNIE